MSRMCAGRAGGVLLGVRPPLREHGVEQRALYGRRAAPRRVQPLRVALRVVLLARLRVRSLLHQRDLRW